MKPYNNPQKKYSFFSVLIFSCLLICVVSCKKGDDGAVGPAGPAGAAGVAGPTGPIGAANVIYSDWFTASPWIKDTVFDIFRFSYTKVVTGITQSIIDSGTVITVGKLNGYNTLVWPSTQVAQMPIIISYKFSPGGITYTDTWSALVTPGNLTIRFVNDQNYYNSISTSHEFRYIIIPGGVKANAAAVIKKDGTVESNAVSAHGASSVYSQMSYHELCTLLNIPE